MNKSENKKTLIILWLLASLFSQVISLYAQQTVPTAAIVQPESFQNSDKLFQDLLQHSRGAEFAELLEKVFGGDAGAAANAFDENSEELFQAVNSAASGKAEESLEKQ